MKFGICAWYCFLVTEHIHTHTERDYFIIGIDTLNSIILTTEQIHEKLFNTEKVKKLNCFVLKRMTVNKNNETKV